MGGSKLGSRRHIWHCQASKPPPACQFFFLTSSPLSHHQPSLLQLKSIAAPHINQPLKLTRNRVLPTAHRLIRSTFSKMTSNLSSRRGTWSTRGILDIHLHQRQQHLPYQLPYQLPHLRHPSSAASMTIRIISSSLTKQAR